MSRIKELKKERKMTHKEYIWGLDGTTIIDKLLKKNQEKEK